MGKGLNMSEEITEVPPTPEVDTRADVEDLTPPEEPDVYLEEVDPTVSEDEAKPDYEAEEVDETDPEPKQPAAKKATAKKATRKRATTRKSTTAKKATAKKDEG